MTTPGTGLLVKAYKEALRKVHQNHDNVHAKARISHRQLSANVDPRRALAKFKQLLLERELGSAWSIGKQRAQERLQAAVAYASSVALQTSATSSSISSSQRDATAEEVERNKYSEMFDSNPILRSSLLYLIATASRAFMTKVNHTSVDGVEHLKQALQRPQGQALITVSNHVAAMDDPLVISSLVPSDYFSDPDKLRWTLCASDRCFHKPYLVPFFRALKVLPVERGAGLHQPGMDAAQQRLSEGDWVHIFPEGTRSRDGKMGKVRKGVGKLVADCQQPPIILPFVHSGMEALMPKGAKAPAMGKGVRVLVGEPVQVDDLVLAAQQQGWSRDELYVAVSNRVSRELRRLKASLDGEALPELEADAGSHMADDWAVIPVLDYSSSSGGSDLMPAGVRSEVGEFYRQHREWLRASCAGYLQGKAEALREKVGSWQGRVDGAQQALAGRARQWRSSWQDGRAASGSVLQAQVLPPGAA